MSADAWRVCPKCKYKHEIDTRIAEKKARESYGKVSAEEFDRLREVAREMVCKLEKMDETLREDYEIYTDETGEFFISYYCWCEACGLKFNFNHKQNVLAEGK